MQEAVAAGMVKQPAASLPQQARTGRAIKGAYRLLGEADVSLAALSAPHWAETRAAAAEEAVVLLVQDTTALDYTAQPTMTGLGPIGDGRGRGVLLHSVLAVEPVARRVLGLLHQHAFARQSAPEGETRTQRRQRAKELDIWAAAAVAVGAPPSGRRWVHVGDRGSDSFAFLAACREQGADFLVRAGRAHAGLARATGATGAAGALADQLDGGGPGAPHPALGRASLPCWLVRVWEPAPPPGEPGLEWVLLTSVPTETVAAAWERADWYACRWLIEDYHQCLKTGCRVEQRRFGDAAPLLRLLGLLAPVAIELLRLRDHARAAPQRPAAAIAARDLLGSMTK